VCAFRSWPIQAINVAVHPTLRSFSPVGVAKARNKSGSTAFGLLPPMSKHIPTLVSGGLGLVDLVRFEKTDGTEKQ
jgi:hypothetical protein